MSTGGVRGVRDWVVEGGIGGISPCGHGLGRRELVRRVVEAYEMATASSRGLTVTCQTTSCLLAGPSATPPLRLPLTSASVHPQHPRLLTLSAGLPSGTQLGQRRWHQSSSLRSSCSQQASERAATSGLWELVHEQHASDPHSAPGL